MPMRDWTKAAAGIFHAIHHDWISESERALNQTLPADYYDQFTTRASIEPIAVGQPLPDMPLFLKPNGCVMVPLETTYETASCFLPRRWQKVLAT